VLNVRSYPADSDRIAEPARSALGSKAEKLKAKQWGFSSEKIELFADEPVRYSQAPEI
jgi:hypothetical protein